MASAKTNKTDTTFDNQLFLTSNFVAWSETIATSKYQWVGYSRVTYSHVNIDFTGSFSISRFVVQEQ